MRLGNPNAGSQLEQPAIRSNRAITLPTSLTQSAYPVECEETTSDEDRWTGQIYPSGGRSE